jgi:hypothetical protein
MSIPAMPDATARKDNSKRQEREQHKDDHPLIGCHQNFSGRSNA